MQQEPGHHLLAPYDAGPPTCPVVAQVDVDMNRGTRDLQAQAEAQIVVDISHELRTSLAVITLLSGNLDLLYERLDEERRRRMIREIREHTQRVNVLVGDVLDLCQNCGFVPM